MKVAATLLAILLLTVGLASADYAEQTQPRIENFTVAQRDSSIAIGFSYFNLPGGLRWSHFVMALTLIREDGTKEFLGSVGPAEFIEHFNGVDLLDQKENGIFKTILPVFNLPKEGRVKVTFLLLGKLETTIVGQPQPNKIVLSPFYRKKSNIVEAEFTSIQQHAI